MKRFSGLIYRVLHFVVRHTFPLAFRRFECVGEERLPSDGAVILAPNHTNGLLDAFAMLWLARRSKKILFVARADVFRKPWAAAILRSFNMLPIMRIRDGYQNLSKNDAIMQQCVDALKQGTPFCIMPEGTHRAERGQLPLVKGIFRIALMADEHMSDGRPVYIVPVGINYGNFFRYRSSLLLHVGEPIDVSAYKRAHTELSYAEQLMQLRSMLAERLEGLHLAVPEVEHRDSLEEACSLLPQRGFTPLEQLQRCKEVVRALASDSAEGEALKAVEQYAELRHRARIDRESVPDSMSQGKLLLALALLLVELPYFLLSLLMVLPSLVVSELAVRCQSDRAMDNSLRYVVSLLLYPVTLVAVLVVLCNYLPVVMALAAMVVVTPAFFFFYDYCRLARRTYCAYALCFQKRLRMRYVRAKELVEQLIK